MKKSLLALNVIFVITLLFSAYSLYSAVTPILTGKVTVEMQNQDDIEWEFGNDTVSAQTWVDIINGGNYEIRDARLHIWIIHNETGLRLLDMKKDIPPVPAGTTHREYINASIDLSLLPEDIKNKLWTEYANFTVYADINAYFMNAGGQLLVHYHNTIPWEPLLKYINIEENNTQIYYDSSTGSMNLYVPYVVSTSSLLSGSASVLVEIYNDTSLLSSTTEDIELGRDYSGTAVFRIGASDTYYLMTHSTPIPVVAALEYSGISMRYNDTYQWGAPFNDLYIGGIQYAANSISMNYSFTNEFVRDLDLTINVIIYDSAGSVIGTQDEHYIAYRYGTVSRDINIQVSGHPDYAEITITENISGWSHTIRRDA